MSSEVQEIRRWPRLRSILGLFLKYHRPHTAYGFNEVDISPVLSKLQTLEQTSGTKVSLNTYLVYAMGQMAARYEASRTFKKGQHAVIFKHANIAIPILKKLPDGLEIPVLYIVRKAETKELLELDRELRTAIEGDLAQDSDVKRRRFVSRLPIFVQRLIYWFIFRNPERMNQHFGNMGLTNLRYLNSDSPLTAFPPNVYSVQVAVGSTSQKFLPDDEGRPILRSVLHLGAGVDHLIMDGMTVARAMKEFADFVEAARGIPEEAT